MRLIGKLLALPFVVVTGILYLVCKFLVVLSGAVLGILSGIVFLAALLFGFIEALGLRLQKYVPSDLTGMAPYLVTVIMMVAVVLWERKKKNKAVKVEG